MTKQKQQVSSGTVHAIPLSMKKSGCTKVFVYRNLHKNCFSVKCLKTGRVIAHMDSLVLRNAQFKVSKAGRARVLKEKRKNVHAGVVGDWDRKALARRRKRAVTYNPYKYETFVDKTTEAAILSAPVCVIKLTGLSI